MIKGIIFLFFYCLLLTLCIFIPYSLHLVNGVSNVIDPLFYAWNLSYNADNMFSGLSSALNTNIFYPLNNTLAYSDTLWVQSLLTNPIIWLTNNPILAENLAVMFTFPLSAFPCISSHGILRKTRVLLFYQEYFLLFPTPDFPKSDTCLSLVVNGCLSICFFLLNSLTTENELIFFSYASSIYLQ